MAALEVFERIADGLNMPDDARMLLGLAPIHPAGLDHLGPSGRAEVIAAYPSQASATPEIHAAARTAAAIDILAVRGLGIIDMNDSLLRRIVTGAQPRLRALLLNPDSAAAHRRAEEIGEGYESFATGIRLSIAKLRELAEYTAEIEVYTYDLLPTWRVIGVDTALFVSAFGETHEGHTSPMYKIARSTHGALYRGFRRFIDELLTTAHRVV